MIHTIENEYLAISVAEYGAELQSIRDASGHEYLWQGDSTYWKDRAINLFPYVARLTNGVYSLDGELYHMDIHGLAPYQEFHLERKSETQMAFRLDSSKETYEKYPREFAFRVIYCLIEKTLRIRYEVENRDSRSMRFGLGGHPGFLVPMDVGRTFEDYALCFADPCDPKRIEFTPQNFLSGQEKSFPLQDQLRIQLQHDLFNDGAIVLKDMAREVTLVASVGGRAIRVSFPQMPYLGIWHKPGTDAPYVCIEPWCSLPSKQDEIAVFETQSDLLCCEPGETYKNTWTIEIL